ncbi:hypothetical protein Droror1_Dr00020641 [Drosera rotundifolia]
MAYHIFGNAMLQQISKRIPRTKEELLEVHGISKGKMSKYGDRILETIEATIKEFYQKSERNSSGGSNDSTDSTNKRRRDGLKDSNGSTGEDESFENMARIRKRAAKALETRGGEISELIEEESFSECIDVDIDLEMSFMRHLTLMGQIQQLVDLVQDEFCLHGQHQHSYREANVKLRPMTMFHGFYFPFFHTVRAPLVEVKHKGKFSSSVSKIDRNVYVPIIELSSTLTKDSLHHRG